MWQQVLQIIFWKLNKTDKRMRGWKSIFFFWVFCFLSRESKHTQTKRWWSNEHSCTHHSASVSTSWYTASCICACTHVPPTCLGFASEQYVSCHGRALGNSGHGMSLVVQWLRLSVSIAGDSDSILGWETKIPHAMQHGQKKKAIITHSSIDFSSSRHSVQRCLLCFGIQLWILKLRIKGQFWLWLSYHPLTYLWVNTLIAPELNSVKLMTSWEALGQSPQALNCLVLLHNWL